MAKDTTVLVVGATGMLGRHVIQSLLGQGGAQVRALLRPGKREEAERLRSIGVSPVEGDVLDPASLDAACRGADVVVSTVHNDPQVQVDGQKNLIRAAVRAGVSRFIPSDFSLDFFRLDYGDNFNLDMRKQVREVLAESGLRATHVLNGAFMEVMLEPGIGPVHPEDATFVYWGDGEQPVDLTTVPDAARYTAAAALDPDAPEVLRVAGDVRTMRELKAIYERVTGVTLRDEQRGAVDDLRRHIQQLRETAGSPWEYVFFQYHWAMVSGKGKLDPLDNDRYPQIRPQSFEEFLRERRQAGA